VNYLKSIGTGNIFKADRIKVCKINGKHSPLRMSDLVIRLGCSLSYQLTWYLNHFILNNVDCHHSAF